MVKRAQIRHGKFPMKIVCTAVSAAVLIVLGFLNPWLMAFAAVIAVFVFSRKK